MIELEKDRKSSTWILTKTDKEGFHRQMNLTQAELDCIVTLWSNFKKDAVHTIHKDRHR